MPETFSISMRRDSTRAWRDYALRAVSSERLVVLGRNELAKTYAWNNLTPLTLQPRINKKTQTKREDAVLARFTRENEIPAAGNPGRNNFASANPQFAEIFYGYLGKQLAQLHRLPVADKLSNQSESPLSQPNPSRVPGRPFFYLIFDSARLWDKSFV